MGFRKDYFSAVWTESRRQWDTGEQVTTFVLAGVSAIGWLGLLFDAWKSGGWITYVAGASSVLLVFYFVWLLVVDTPAQMWRDYQPGPFELEFRPPVLEGAAGYGDKKIIRITVRNLGGVARCEPRVVDTDGVHSWSAHVPLAWSNRVGSVHDLGSAWEQITIGMVYDEVGHLPYATVTSSDEVGRLYEHAGKVKPNGATPSSLRFDFEVLNVDTHQAVPRSVQITGLGSGSAQIDWAETE